MSNKLHLTTEKLDQTTKGIMFIVPNHAVRPENFIIPKEKCLSSLPDDEQYIEVWCVTEGLEESNWQDHPEKHSKDFRFNNLNPGYWSNYLPSLWLKDKKEGDIILINVYDEDDKVLLKQYEIKLQQKGYRYERFGNFEEVFAKVTA